EVDDIGDQQQQYNHSQQWLRIVCSDVAGDALPGDPADASTDLLDRCHQGEGEQHDPAHRQSELRSGLRVSGDAGWVVVGGAGDQSGSKCGPKPLPGWLARCSMESDPGGEKVPGGVARMSAAHWSCLPPENRSGAD